MTDFFGRRFVEPYGKAIATQGTLKSGSNNLPTHVRRSLSLVLDE
jgi:hypothetical protein